MLLCTGAVFAGQLRSQQAVTGLCDKSVLYWTVGTIDRHYDLSHSELESIIEETASVWSDAAGKELFKKDPMPSDSTFYIQLIYSSDQRQFDTETEIADSIRTMRRQFYPKQAAYRNQTMVYKKSYEEHGMLMETYNNLIDDYNEVLNRVLVAGARSAREQERIDNLRIQVERMKPRLAESENDLLREELILIQLSDELNRLADRINELIYIQNEFLGKWTTFRKGAFMNVGDRPKINIYQFDNLDQLRLILAHELGHALGLPHVQNSESVMYYRAEHQRSDRLSLTIEDLNALNEVCNR